MNYNEYSQYLTEASGYEKAKEQDRLRKEKLETAVGTFNTIFIRPEMELKGKFQPIGENLIWLSDDDRKFILRIEAKIKIGTLVSEVTELNPGNP